MKMPSMQHICLCACLVLGPLSGIVGARGNDAAVAVKAVEAKLRAETSTANKPRASAPVPPAPPQENFFTKLSRMMGVSPSASPAAPARVAKRSSGDKELPVVTVRENRSASKGEPVDLGKLVSGILQRLGPMELERSDDAVLNPSSDSLALLAHPNIQPIVPVAPIAAPGRASNSVPLPNPLTEQRTSWLAAKVAEKLQVMQSHDATLVAKAEVAPPAAPKSRAVESVKERERIELMAILAVSQKSAPPAPEAKLANRGEVGSRIGAVSLLASASEGGEAGNISDPASGAKLRLAPLRELPRYPEAKLEPVPAIKPVREIESANRTRVLMLLQPDSLAGAP